MNKKVLISVILGVFLILVVATGVSAALKDFTDPIKDMFANWTAGHLSQNIAKYLFFILIALFIYSMVGVLPFVGAKRWYIQWPVALIIAFLAVAYLTPESIYAMLTGYGAMALVLGGLIPIMILIFFTIELESSGEMGKGIVTFLIWFAFIIFWIYKLVEGLITKQYSMITAIPWFIVILVGIIFLVWKRKIMKAIFKSESKAALADSTRDLISSYEAEIKRREKRNEELANNPNALKAWKLGTERLKSELNKIK